MSSRASGNAMAISSQARSRADRRTHIFGIPSPIVGASGAPLAVNPATDAARMRLCTCPANAQLPQWVIQPNGHAIHGQASKRIGDERHGPREVLICP